MSCKDCISGVKHEGEPTGKPEQIGGVDCYVATPSGDYAKDKVFLFLPDAFGLPLVNSKLLADSFAQNGYQTIIVDVFNGDPVPIDVLEKAEATGERPQFDFPAWIGKHGDDVTLPIINKVIDALKAKGVNSFAATGYCFGGRYVFQLAFTHKIKVGVVAHPSLLKIPEDLETYAKEAEAPLLINACEVDQQFPKEAQAQSDSIIGGAAKFSGGKYKQTYAEGCTHGFAVRGDMSNPKIKAGKERAFTGTIEWLKEHF